MSSSGWTFDKTYTSIHVCVTWETYQKRPMKGDLHIRKETCIYEKRPIHMSRSGWTFDKTWMSLQVCVHDNHSKETYTYEKRPANMKKRPIRVSSSEWTCDKDVDVTAYVCVDYMGVISKET